jgi:hypothetical protein
MKVFIIESSYPKDFYTDRLDGLAARNLLNTMGVENQLRMVLDLGFFKQAIRDAAAHGFDVLHLSCHGNDDGIALCDNTQPTWDDFVRIFDDMRYSPSALVMSACCGASSGISTAFRDVTHRPKIIFGSTTPLGYSEYCVAWAILYHRLQVDGVRRNAARIAMQHINAVVVDQFVYRRWDDDREAYASYPGRGFTYSVQEIRPQHGS